jgi:DNA polymerase III subunit chi
LTEVLFYHLTERPLEQVLPEILEKSLQRGWKVGVRGTARARIDMLDSHLWTFRDDAFLPHGQASEANARLQPVLLGVEEDFANQPQVLVLVDGARFAPAATAERICLLFDGNDPDRLAEAREDWKAVGQAGLKAIYWAQDGGKWVKRAESG